MNAETPGTPGTTLGTPGMSGTHGTPPGSPSRNRSGSYEGVHITGWDLSPPTPSTAGASGSPGGSLLESKSGWSPLEWGGWKRWEDLKHDVTGSHARERLSSEWEGLLQELAQL